VNDDPMYETFEWHGPPNGEVTMRVPGPTSGGGRLARYRALRRFFSWKFVMKQIWRDLLPQERFCAVAAGAAFAVICAFMVYVALE
jgi:hypothetical protein